MNIKLHSTMYEKFTYPDGCSMQVRIKPEYIPLFQKENNTVLARVRSSEDLVEARLLCSAVKGISKDLSLEVVLPYLPYSRADRRFVEGDCFGREFIFEFFTNFEIDSIVTYDIHSHPSKNQDHLWWFKNISPKVEIEAALFDFWNNAHRPKIINILMPDEGAFKRYEGMLELSYYGNFGGFELIFNHCEKKRNLQTGKFEGFTVPKIPNFATFIIDDICDGGGTFLGIAEQLGLKDKGLPKPLGLFTSHGIYSKGLEDLTRYYDKLYCVDTFMPYEEYDKHFCGYMNSGQLTVLSRFF